MTTQISFARLWDGFATDEAAKKARDERAKALKNSGLIVRRWTLRDQQKLDDHGNVVGVCPAYFIDYEG